MVFFSRIVDRLVLIPTTDALEVPHLERRVVSCNGGDVEFWVRRSRPRDAGKSAEPQLYVLKFHGAGGRAERASLHPLDIYDDLPGEVWSVNPPGYGGSSGPATLGRLCPAALTVFDLLEREAGGRPILVTGNSLGTASALYLAARRPVSGVILRNATPLQRLIAAKRSYWNLWSAGLVATGVPEDLDTIAAAAGADVPAVFVSCRRDRVVAPPLQDLVIDAYRGEKRVLHLAEAGHVDLLNEAEAAEYVQHLNWLRERMRA